MDTMIATAIANIARFKGKKPKDKRGTHMSPHMMQEQSLAKNKAIRTWAMDHKLGTKPGTFPDPFPNGFVTPKGRKNRVYA